MHRTFFKENKSIMIFSVIGLMLNIGLFLRFPSVMWDNEYVWNNQIAGSLLPTNWMGWFYPYFWKGLYQITGMKLSIGLVPILLYWISLPIIYCNLFPKNNNKSYFLWYVLFVCNPLVLPQFFWITNNILQLGFLLLAIACWSSFYKSGSKIFVVLAWGLFLLISWLRRDAILLCFPLACYFGSLLVGRKRVFIGFISGILFLTVFLSVNKVVAERIPEYETSSQQLTIDSLALTMLFDLTMMGMYKGDVIIPDEILKPEYRGEEKIHVAEYLKREGKPKMLFEWDPFQGMSYFFQSNTVWQNGLELQQALPVYIKNIPWYLLVKINMLYAYLYILGLFIVILCVSLPLLFEKQINVFSYAEKEFLIFFIVTSLFYGSILLLTVLSVQARYFINNAQIIWMTGICILYRVRSQYKKTVRWELKN